MNPTFGSILIKVLAGPSSPGHSPAPKRAKF